MTAASSRASGASVPPRRGAQADTGGGPELVCGGRQRWARLKRWTEACAASSPLREARPGARMDDRGKAPEGPLRPSCVGPRGPRLGWRGCEWRADEVVHGRLHFYSRGGHRLGVLWCRKALGVRGALDCGASSALERRGGGQSGRPQLAQRAPVLPPGFLRAGLQVERRQERPGVPL